MANGLEKGILDPESEELELFKNEFIADFNGDEPWRLKAKEWNDFYHGRQWADDEIQELESRGQPVVVRNRIKPKVDAMVGVELGLKVNTKAVDRGSRDFEKAKYISEALRLIEDDNDFDSIEAKVFSSAIKTGRGWYETEIEWVDLEAFTKTSQVSTKDVVPDRHGRKEDMSDWKRVHRTMFMDLDDAQKLWPDKSDQLEQSVMDAKSGFEEQTRAEPHKTIIGDQYNATNDSNNVFSQSDRKRIRVVRTWYRTHEAKLFITHPEFGTEEITGTNSKEIQKLKDLFQGAQIWSKFDQKMNYITFTSNAILEHEKDTRPFDTDAKFPITLMAGWLDEERGYHVGIIEQLLDPQREVNKRGSKMLHLLNTNQIFMDEGAVEDLNKTRQEAARSDGVLVAKRGFKFEIQKNLDIAQVQFQLMTEAKGEIDAAGAAAELIGQSRATSGKDFQLRQQAAIQPIRELFLNARAARRQVAFLWLDDIQQYWRAERMIKLTDDEEAGQIVLNEKIVDPETGAVVIKNDVSVGRYDIKIEEAPDTMNIRSENFQGLIKLAQLGVPIPPDILIEMSDLPHKQRFLEAAKAQAEQQAQQQAQLNAQQQAKQLGGGK